MNLIHSADFAGSTMTTFPKSLRIVGFAGCLIAYGYAAECAAQSPRRGELEIRAIATGEERTAQSDLWVMDVYYKPMRMITVELTDPETGEKKSEYVWYIVYRTYNRQLTRSASDTPPQNVLDPEVITPPLFVPEFTLLTTDTETPQTFTDQVIPEALPVIRKREQGEYQSSVDIVGPIPAAGDLGDPDRKGLWGVATWRGIDPEADHYTVFLTGFSNGIRKIEAPDGKPATLSKSIEMKFWRPGDKFDQTEPEIRPVGRAQWIYR
jgi:hypothetical protein